MSRKFFGTDGVRGRANSYPMTADFCLKLGAAAGSYFRRANKKSHRVVIGKDTRLSGYCLLYTSPSPRDGLLSRMPSSA